MNFAPCKDILKRGENKRLSDGQSESRLFIQTFFSNYLPYGTHSFVVTPFDELV